MTAAGSAVPRRQRARQLIRPTLRTMPWAQLVAGGGIALVLVLATTSSADLPMSSVVERLWVASVLLAVGIAGVLDDPTRPHLDTTPVSLALRQSLRLFVALGVTGGWWALVLLAAAYHPAMLQTSPRAGAVPATAVSVVAAALVLVTLAVAAVVTRSSGGRGAISAAATALAVPALAAIVPRLVAAWSTLDLTMLPRTAVPEASGPDGAAAVVDPVWLAAHQRWLAIAVLAGLVLAWALPGPAAQHRSRRQRMAAVVPPEGIDDEGTRP